MKLLTAQQIREWDAYTIVHKPITSLNLMEHAAQSCVSHLINEPMVQVSQSIHVFCGTGNNGGDGMAIARLIKPLIHASVYVYVIQGAHSSPNFIANLNRLDKIQCITLASENDFPVIAQNDIVIDAIFGTGLNKPVDGLVLKLVRYLNQSNGYIIAIDIPSGLMPDLDQPFKNFEVFKAHQTLTFQIPKLSFLFPESGKYIGKLVILDIGLLPDFNENQQSPYHLLNGLLAKSIIRTRGKFSHKGDFGHALLVGGSFGKMGAAILMSKAALRTGCGLITAYIPKTGYTILQTALPECMVQTDDELFELGKIPETINFNAVAIGPGMGQEEKTIKAFENWLPTQHKPIVLDADALNICSRLLAKNPDAIKFPVNSILTPHPKEFDRLTGISMNAIERLEKQRHFAQKHQIILVLKGAHTSIAFPNGEVYFNFSGNEAIATAGSGDVLTGMIVSLLAQSYEPKAAALLGVYIHGLAGDLAVKGKSTLIATDIIEAIPLALYQLHIQ